MIRGGPPWGGTIPEVASAGLERVSKPAAQVLSRGFATQRCCAALALALFVGGVPAPAPASPVAPPHPLRGCLVLLTPSQGCAMRTRVPAPHDVYDRRRTDRPAPTATPAGHPDGGGAPRRGPGAP